MPYPVCFYLILRSSVAAVTPGHPNQSLCPVCVGVQRREDIVAWTSALAFLRSPHVQASGLALKQVRALWEQLMYFEAGQCVDATEFLVKPVLRSGVQTAIAWRWNRIAMGCGQGGGRVQEPSHLSQADVAVREGLRSERAGLLPLNVHLVGDQDGYALGVRAEACLTFLVS